MSACTIIVEGPDKSGKTTTAKKLAHLLDGIYWKPAEQSEAMKSSTFYGSPNPEAFLTLERFSVPAIIRLCQAINSRGITMVIDRSTPSEWCYSRVFGRPTDENILLDNDEAWSNIDARLLVLARRQYDAKTKDELVKAEQQQKLAEVYRTYCGITKMQHVFEYVDEIPGGTGTKLFYAHILQELGIPYTFPEDQRGNL